MIRLNNKDIISVIHLGQVVSAIYKGAVLVWQAVRSCFGSGVWNSEKPWLSDEEWSSTK